MRWTWRHEARPIEPRRAVNFRRMELQTAKEILAEVFHARPGDVEEMIKKRLEESGPEERVGGGGGRRRSALLPPVFCQGCLTVHSQTVSTQFASSLTIPEASTPQPEQLLRKN